EFHRALARKASAEPGFHFHYVTSREMYNLVRAAEDGWQGTVAEARDYELVLNGTRQPASHANGLVVGKSTLGFADPPLGEVRLPRHGHPTLAAEAHSSPPGGVGERG